MVHQCPVGFLRGDVDRTLRVFDLIYELRHHADGRWEWVRTSLPEPGGVLDQPARLMDELAWVLELKREILADTLREQSRECT